MPYSHTARNVSAALRVLAVIPTALAIFVLAISAPQSASLAEAAWIPAALLVLAGALYLAGVVIRLLADMVDGIAAIVRLNLPAPPADRPARIHSRATIDD